MVTEANQKVNSYLVRKIYSTGTEKFEEFLNCLEKKLGYS